MIGADSSCGGGVDIGFYSYLYYEYAGGTAVKEATVNTPSPTSPARRRLSRPRLQ
ncbi:hypothetical protein NKH77_34285 [Streptomyces sp. M19]